MSRVIAKLGLVGAGVGLFAIPAIAAPWEFSGNIRGDAGYARNPYLSVGGNGDRNSISLGGNIEGRLTQREATSNTVLSGFYNRQFYTNRYDDSDSFGGALERQQQFSETLTGRGRVGYSSTRNAFTSDFEDIIDRTTLGTRRKAVDGSASLTWTPSARDSFTLSGYGTHATYSTGGFGEYDFYGSTLRYDRTIDDRTSAGVSVGVSHTDSDGFGKTDTISPNFNVTRKLNAYWTLDGSVGLIFQETDFLGRSSKSRTVGFDATLCGKYPRWDLCAQASRSTSASGFGGLRTETFGSLRYNYNITERSRANLSGIIGESRSEDRSFLAPRQRYASLDAGYSRDISRRLSAGLNAGYRYRKFERFGDAHGFTATVNLSAKIGRLR